MALAAAWVNAQSNWGNFAVISDTLGNYPNRICVGEGLRVSDIGCPSYAPFIRPNDGYVGIGTTNPNAALDVHGTVSATNLRLSGNLYVSGSQTIDGVVFANGGVSATGVVTATAFYGDGSGLTNLNVQGDRIVSGTHAVIANQNTGYVSLTTGGSTWGYVSAGWSYLANLFVTTVSSSLVSATHVSATYVDATRHGTVSGTYGYFRYVSGTDIHGRFTGDGSGLTNLSVSGDRIVSDSSNVTVAQNGSVTIFTAGSQRMVVGENGYVGIGTSNPGAPLDVLSADNATAIIRANTTASLPAVLRLIGTGSGGSASQDTKIVAYQPPGGAATDAALDFRVRKNGDAFGNPGTIMTLLGIGRTHVSGTFVVSTTEQDSTSPTLWVANDGSVRIGTTYAGAKLRVYAEPGYEVIARFDGNSSIAPVRALVNNQGGHDAQASFMNAGVTQWTFGNRGSTNNFTIRNGAGAFGTASDRFTIVSTSGYVGIGTTTPSSTLHVQSTYPVLMLGDSNASSLAEVGGRIAFTDANGFTHSQIGPQGSDNEFVIRNNNAGPVSVIIGGAYKPIHISPTGRLGINNNTDPRANLDVIGTISATGAIQVGQSTLACGSVVSGTIRYNTTSDTLQVCTGNGWKSLVSGTTSGVATAVSSTGAIQFNSANALGGDTDNLFWDNANKRLGVGTSSPAQLLDVANTANTGSAADNASMQVRSTNRNASVVVRAGSAHAASVQFGDAATTKGLIEYYNAGSGSPDAMRFTTSGTEKVRITHDGKVGVGTGAPNATLEVSGSMIVSNGAVYIGSANASNNYLALLSGGVGYNVLAFRRQGAERGRIQYQNSNDSLQFSVSTTERVRITHEGKVGIGTTAPGTMLDVSTSGTGIQDLAVFSGGNPAVANNGARVYFTAGSGTGRAAYVEGGNSNGASNGHYVALGTSAASSAPSERMRIIHDGRMGIGKAPVRSATVDISLSTPLASAMRLGRVNNSTEGGDLRLDYPENDGTSDVSAWIMDVYGSAATPNLRFYRTDSGGVTKSPLYLSTYGSVSLTDALQLGASSLSCVAGINGSIRYVNAINSVEVCANGSWTALSSNTTVSGGLEDRISSGTHVVVVNTATGNTSLSTGGTTWGYLGNAASFLPTFLANRVGISTTSPNATLDVAGHVRLSGPTSNTITWGTTGVAAPGAGSVGMKLHLYGATPGVMNSSDFAIGVEAGHLWFNTTTGMKWYVGSSERMRLTTGGVSVTGFISTTGVVDVGTQVLGNGGDSAGAPTYSWTGDTDTGVFTPGADAIGFTTGGSERMRVTSGGNVGIGAAPGARLHVSGGNTLLEGGTVFVSRTNTQDVRYLAGQGPAWRTISTINGATPGKFVIQYSNDNYVANFVNAMELHPIGTVSLTNALQLGASSLTCNAGLAGAVRYSATSGTVQVCHSSAWTSLVSDSAVGSMSAASSTGAVQFNANGNFGGDTNTFFWDNANKRLGIGTNAPGGGLHVVANTGSAIIASATHSSYGLAVTPNGTAFSGIYLSSSGDGQNFLRDRIGNIGVMLNSNGSSYFSGGNVGIATSTPAHTLEVSGVAAVTRELRVGYGSPAIDMTSSGGISLRMGRFTGVPTNATDAFIGVAESTFPGPAGDLVLIPRSTATSNNIRFYTGSGTPAEKMRITSAGSIGIGTATPNSSLTVVAGEVQTASSGKACTSAQNGGALRYASGILYYCNGANTWVDLSSSAGGPTGSGAANHIAYWSGASTLAHDANQLYWDAANNRMGIGTAAPGAALDVAGHVRLSGPTSNTLSWGTTGVAAPGAASAGMKLQLYGATPGTMTVNDFAIGVESSHLWFNTGSAMKWYTAATERMRLTTGGVSVTGFISTTGVVDVGTQVLGNGGDSMSAPTYSWTGDTNTGMFTPGADAIGFTTGGTEKVRVTSAGNVGISTTTPAFKLDINTTGAESAQVVLRNTSTGDVGIYFDASNGDLVGADYMWFGQKNNLSAVWETYGAAGDISIMPKGGVGYVGIGTGTPNEPLHVSSTTGRAFFGDGGGATRKGLLVVGAETGNYARLDAYDYGAAAGRQLRINTFGGNVSIGAIAPKASLDVAGTISASDAVQVGSSSLTCGAGIPGAIRYSAPNLQYCNGTSWTTLGGGGADNLGNHTATQGLAMGGYDITGVNQVLGGFGTVSTGGTLDWNHVSNARSGSGYSLLLGTAANGPGTGTYFHPFSFEYGTKDGSGQLTQFAIPYGETNHLNGGFFMRGRYSGTWSSWRRILTENSAGNVGIGTSVPSAGLHLVQTVAGGGLRTEVQNLSTANNSAAELLLRNGTGSVYTSIQTNNSSGAPYSYIGGTAGVTGGMYLDVQANAPLIFRTNASTERMRITGSGYVGIGTVGPNDQLDVVDGNIATNKFLKINSWSAAYGTGYGSIWYDGAGGSGSATGFMGIGHDGNTSMVIDRGGNVGIGYTAPSYKLHVIGDVYADTGWLRSSGVTGWYNQTYGGGWYMADVNWIRNYGSKPLLMNAPIVTDNTGVALRQVAGNYGLMHYSDSGNYYMLITNSGDPFGNANSLRPFYVTLSNGNVSFANGSVSIAHATGNVTAPAFLYSSDRRLKENIKPLTGGLAKLETLEPVTFAYISDTTHRERLGLIAQDVEKVFPQAVATGNGGFKAVDYPALVPALVGAVKELKADNDNLRASLRAANNNLVSETVALKAAHAEMRREIDALKRAVGGAR